MADPKNPGQFGNRPDTEQQARRGGQASGGKFQPGSARASAAGRRGAEHQPIEAKRKGGEHSRRGY